MVSSVGPFWLVAALFGLWGWPALAADTYTQFLLEGVEGRLQERNHPEIPDDLEKAVLACMLTAFVNANIPPDDLAQLDAAVLAGTVETDSLAGHYKEMAMFDQDALIRMAEAATQLCPDELQQYHRITG